MSRGYGDLELFRALVAVMEDETRGMILRTYDAAESELELFESSQDALPIPGPRRFPLLLVPVVPLALVGTRVCEAAIGHAFG